MAESVTPLYQTQQPDNERPHIYVEPPIPTTTEFTTVDQLRNVLHQLDVGNFRQPALLVERMLWNPRLRAVLSTRLAGLISTEIEFLPSQNNRDGRRAAKEFAQDWPLIASAPMRKQMLKWSIFLGTGFAQRLPDESVISGRQILKLRPYWPGWATWYWAQKAYRIITFDRGVTETASPSVDVRYAFAGSPFLDPPPPPNQSPWVICEPFGVNSYREGLVHAAWRPWLGHDWAMRDQARASEKYGIGVIKAKYPRGRGEEHKAAINKFTNDLRNMGAEGVIPLEQRGETGDGGATSFDAEPFEFNGSGFQAIGDTLNSNAVALAILLLGHNMTTEIKGGGSYASAGVGEFIRDDVKHEDTETEWSYVGPQLAQPWAMLNYGDPGLAPRARYITDSPGINLKRAQMIFALSQAAAYLRANVPRVDLDALAEQFQLPMLDDSVKVQVPPLPAAPGAPTPAKPAEAA